MLTANRRSIFDPFDIPDEPLTVLEERQQYEGDPHSTRMCHACGYGLGLTDERCPKCGGDAADKITVMGTYADEVVRNRKR